MPRNRSEKGPTIEGAPEFALDILRAEVVNPKGVRALWKGGSPDDQKAYQDLGAIKRLRFRRDYTKWVRETNRAT